MSEEALDRIVALASVAAYVRKGKPVRGYSRVLSAAQLKKGDHVLIHGHPRRVTAVNVGSSQVVVKHVVGDPPATHGRIGEFFAQGTGVVSSYKPKHEAQRAVATTVMHPSEKLHVKRHPSPFSGS